MDQILAEISRHFEIIKVRKKRKHVYNCEILQKNINKYSLLLVYTPLKIKMNRDDLSLTNNMHHINRHDYYHYIALKDFLTIHKTSDLIVRSIMTMSDREKIGYLNGYKIKLLY